MSEPLTQQASEPHSYAEQFIDWLVGLGYSHCFFLAGGNIMHFLNAARTRLTCIPVVHEVAAGIAVEYFNQTRPEGTGKAFALVTAGPGVTNILTAMGGAYLESRELMVVAGQVKSTDLADAGMRQRGIQEIDGTALAAPVAKATLQIRQPVDRATVEEIVRLGASDRQGPVFVEFCLDAQAASPLAGQVPADRAQPVPLRMAEEQSAQLRSLVTNCRRPVLLLGGGVSRAVAAAILPRLQAMGMPIATSWNALDRIDYDDPLNFGRPDTWGMRWSNVLIQQADLVIAVGARLSLQQTGFNWQAFAPVGSVVHVDLDPTELHKGHPRVDLRIQAEAHAFLGDLVDLARATGSAERAAAWESWRTFGKEVQQALPLDDPGNTTAPGYLSPYAFVSRLSDVLTPQDILVPCSSGGASTVLMQAFRQRLGQIVINDKALASMGYGLSGAIGAAIANPHRRTILVEGDGGFAQNLQELGTVRIQHLALKIFIYSNEGYASIRMTQRNYFGGSYVGCDVRTGLGFPDWEMLMAAYGIPVRSLNPADPFDAGTLALLAAPGPAAFIVPLDPEQTYFPKISSRVTPTGTMESNPIHLMSPDLPADLTARVMPHLS